MNASSVAFLVFGCTSGTALLGGCCSALGYRPYDGLMRLPDEPLRAALAALGER